MDNDCNKQFRFCHDRECVTHAALRLRIMGDAPPTPTMSLKSAIKYVLARDMFICQLCFFPCFPHDGYTNSTIAPSVDHIVEARRNGKITLNNVRLAHRFCNSAREAYPDPRLHPKFQRKIADKVMAILESPLERAA